MKLKIFEKRLEWSYIFHNYTNNDKYINLLAYIVIFNNSPICDYELIKLLNKKKNVCIKLIILEKFTIFA